MINTRKNHILLLLGSMLLLQGCSPPQAPVYTPECPTRGQSQRVLDDMRQALGASRAFRAGGDLQINYYDDRKKAKNENLTLKLWFSPPDNIFVLGSSLVGEVLRMGTNRDEFWVRLKPKEIDSYWWGRREDLDKCGNQQIIRPDYLLLALGVFPYDAIWIYSTIDGFDVLTDYDGLRPIRRVYVDPCTSLPYKVELFDADSQVRLRMMLYNYSEPKEGYRYAENIDLIYLDPDGHDLSTQFRLESVRLEEPKEKIFVRTESKGIGKIFTLDGITCKFLRE
jgi:hypothetical protein